MDPLYNNHQFNDREVPPFQDTTAPRIDVEGTYVEENQGTVNQGELLFGAGRDINISGLVDTKNSTGNQCPNCGTTANNFGRNVCTSCNSVFYARSPDNYVATHKTLTPDESTKYTRLISGIKIAIRTKDYDEAWEYCQKITDVNLGIREPESWIHTAMCSFLKEANNEIIRTEAKDILNYLEIAYERAKEAYHDINGAEYQEAIMAIKEISATISTQFFYITRSRLRYLGEPQIDPTTNRPFWSVIDRKWLIQCIGAFQACFKIYPEEKMPLVEAVRELSVIRKWIIKSADGNLHNVEFPNSCLPPGYRKFDAIRKREELIRIIKSIDNNYEAEALYSELRFTINSIEDLPVQSSVIRLGENRFTSSATGFKILDPSALNNKRFDIQDPSDTNEQVNLETNQPSLVAQTNQNQMTTVDSALERTQYFLEQSLTNHHQNRPRALNNQDSPNLFVQILKVAFNPGNNYGKLLILITTVLLIMILTLFFLRLI